MQSLSVSGCNHKFIISACKLDASHFVIFVNVYSPYGVSSDVPEKIKVTSLDNAFLCGETEILIFVKFLYLNHGGNLFAFTEVEQIYKVRTLSLFRTFGDFKALHLKHIAEVCHKKYLVMAGSNKHFAYKVFFTLFHAVHTTAATFLCLVGVESDTLDVADVRVSNHEVFDRYKVFKHNFTVCIFVNPGSSVIAVFVSHLVKFVLDYRIDS